MSEDDKEKKTRQERQREINNQKRKDKRVDKINELFDIAEDPYNRTPLK